MSRLQSRLPLAAFTTVALFAAGCSTSGSNTSNANSSVSGNKVAISASNCPAAATTKLKDGVDIVIGSSLALSGPVGASGNDIVPIVKAVFDQVNAAGGIDGHKLKYVAEDDAYDAARAITNVKDLIDTQNVMATILQLGTAQSTAAQQLHESACTPQLYVSSGAPNFYDPAKHPFSTSNFFPYAANGKLMANFIAKKFPNGAKVGELIWNNDFGTTASKAFNDAANGTSVKVVAQEKHDSTAVSLTSQVTALLDKQPDVLVASTGSSYCTQFIGAARDKGFDGPIILPYACSDASDVLKPLADKAKNVFAGQSLVSVNADTEGAKKFKDFLAKYAPQSNANSSFVESGYQIANLTVSQLKQAAKSSDGLSKVSLMKAVWNTNTQVGLTFPGQKTTINGEFPYPTGYAVMSDWNPTSSKWTETDSAIMANGKQP